MYDDLKGKVALITGAGKKTGIGFSIAEKMASCGSHIVIADLGQGPETVGGIKMGMRQEMEAIARSLAEKYQVETLAVDLDVTRNDSIQQMVHTVKERFKRVDVLVNNAGASFGSPAPFHAYNEEAWIKTVDINLHGGSPADDPKTGGHREHRLQSREDPSPGQRSLRGRQGRSDHADQGYGP
jgi:NAD(P)-dependent dehydrogenase (short-subunit alcohol dehydrogenase family)